MVEGQQTTFADTDSTGILTYNTPDANNETAITSCVAGATNEEVATALYNITSAGISITEIDTYAFYGCAVLTSINLPSTVTKIGSYAFSDSNLNSVTLPPALIEIGPGAFNGTQIAALSIPASATTFSSVGTFTSMSNLTTVTFEAGRTSIPDYALRNAANVTSVIIQNPEMITEIGNYAFGGCTALTLDIPSTVTKIGSYAFSDSNLNSVTLPPALVEIGNHAFDGTQIAALSIPASVTTFSNNGSFANMSSLTTVTFEAGRTRIPDHALRNAANVTSVTILGPETITGIGAYAFRNCAALMSIDIPSTVTDIGGYVFYDCTALTSVNIPSTVTKIGEYAFCNSNLNSVTLPPALVEIGNHAFDGTQIAAVSIPASVTTFSTNGSFANMSSLTTVTFEAGRTSIPDHALHNATNVTKTLIPKSVTSIPGSNTFTGCDNMVLYGYHDTYAIEYALQNGREYRELPVITTESLPDAYLYIPYYTQIESSDAGNSNLYFQAAGLPLGLSLSPSGELTGAPRADGTFNVRISLEDTSVEGSDMWPDMIELTLYVAPRPTDAILLNIVNDYIILDNIGVADPVSGKYIIERYTDEHGNVILRINAGYPFFVRLWIEGIEQILNVEYSVEDGSTRVTIFDQTIQKLDNGEYTAAAEFFENGEHKVVAQNFEIKWKQREDPDNAGDEQTPDDDIGQTPGDDGEQIPGDGNEQTPGGEQTPDTGNPTPGNSNNGVSGGSGTQTPAVTPPAEVPSAPARDNPFGDVSESDWFYEDILYAVENDLMNGTSATSFSPRTPMTRAMIITVLGRLAGADEDANEDAAASGGFSDIETGAYYTPYVAWAAANGLVSGTGAGGFAPNEDVTRQDLATLIVRYADFAGLSVPPLRPAESFDDDAQTADYAKDALRALTAGGILNGKPGNIFDPRGGATRAEVAAILHRFIEATK
jgi:hypothetical protein